MSCRCGLVYIEVQFYCWCLVDGTCSLSMVMSCTMIFCFNVDECSVCSCRCGLVDVFILSCKLPSSSTFNVEVLYIC